MITSIQRIGTEDNNDGWFLVNETLNVRFIDVEDGIDIQMNFNEDVMSNDEANDLANEVLKSSIDYVKKHYDA